MNGKFRYVLADRIDYEAAERLWNASEGNDVFSHPACWRALVESGVHSGKIISVEVRSGEGNLAAVWPFVLAGNGARDLFSEIAQPLGAHYVDYIQPLVSQAGNGVLDCLMDGVSSVFAASGKMKIVKLDPLDNCAGACERLSESAKFRLRRERLSPRMHFRGSYEETEKSLGWSKKHRPSVRIRRIRKDGALSLWVAEDRDSIQQRLEILFDLHRKKWNSQGKPSQFEKPAERSCFLKMAENLPLSMLHYSEVRLDEKVLSCHFGFLCGNWLYWYKPAYDPQHEGLSPGVLHIALLAEHGIGQGWQGIDFLQGDESYKFRWKNDDKPTLDFVMASSLSMPWWIWETRLRDGVREAYFSFRSRIRGG